MTARSFEPKFMKMSVLTAALQELTPREIRDEDPDRAIEDWLQFAREIDCPTTSSSRPRCTRPRRDVPPEAMLDPVANTLDLRKPFDKARAKRVLAAMQATGVGLSDLALLRQHAPRRHRRAQEEADFMLRVLDAAALLGRSTRSAASSAATRSCRWIRTSLIFEEVFIPLLKEAKARGLEYRVEQCPMPGWTSATTSTTTSPTRPGTWIALHRICEKARRRRPVPHPLRSLARDPDGPGHALDLPVPQGRGLRLHRSAASTSRVRSSIAKGVAAWGYGGQTVERGDWKNGKPSPNPADQVNAWKKQTVLCEHELPGTAKHDPLGYLQNRTVDWLDHQLAARELLKLDVANTALVDRARVPAGAHPGQGAARRRS